MYYEAVFNTLNGRGIRYVVTGGMAVVLHGIVRLTADLDIIVDFDQTNINKFAEAMEKLGYRPKAPVKTEELGDPVKRRVWIEEKGMKVFSFFHPKKQLELVDVLIFEKIPFPELYKKRKIVRGVGIEVPIVSVEHLKELKKIAGRPQDLADIKSLDALGEIQQEDA